MALLEQGAQGLANLRKHQGRIALVTGAGGGLGREVALRLASGGARVVALDVNGDALQETARAITEAGHPVHTRVLDVRASADVLALRDWMSDATGEPDILLNVAGILERSGLEDTSELVFRNVLDVNLVGPFLLTQAFAPAMVAKRWGRIVNCASIGGHNGYPFTAYAASKAALINLTKSLLHDLWNTGVTVNSVSPGAMDTPMLDRGAAATMTSRTPSGRITTPADVAAVIDFLVTDEAQAVNGADLTIDGGATAVFRY